MSNFSVRPQYLLSRVVVCLAVLFACTVPVWAQTSTTGALTGTITDPSGGVISGATVTLTSKATGQERTTTTGASGLYGFSLLSPGDYSVKFSASGFKTEEIAPITINITETHVLNQKLEVGAQATTLTVEATVEAIQTQNATVGSLVGSREVTDLPLSSRNYTNIIDLSPGVVANVASAAAVGNGTQDINVNGNGSDQNNYLMDGSTLTNYGSGGAAQSGNFPGIAIPNPDSIQEFRIQTAQYDAEFGRNPGASVNVTTKDGTNSFHGAAWEFFRNTALDANDFFNRISQAELHEPNKPQTLNENMFGGTIGGPIKKDKMFFFFSYQGFRQKNAIGTNGFATGLSTGISLYPFTAPGPNGGRGNNVSGTIPLDYVGAPCSYATYRQYLGCAFGGTKTSVPFFGTQVPVATNGSNINQIAINVLQLPGPKGGLNEGFYVPGVPFGSNGLPLTTSTLITAAVPTQANENQYLGNVEYVVNSKNTLYQKFFYSGDPQIQSFTCLDGIGNLINSCAPGAPEDVNYTSLNETIKLTTVATSNLVNEALFSFVRTTTVAVPGNYISACSVGIIPPLANGSCSNIPTPNNINKIQLELPTISFAGIPMNIPVGYAEGALNTGGNFFSSATNYFNTFQVKDNLSWTHGKQTIRTGASVERLQYNWTLPGRGGMIYASASDFLTSSSGLPDTLTAPAPNGIFVNFFGLTTTNGNKHNQRANQFAAYIEDDMKVSPKLTVNLGLRWEYDGYPTDKTSLFTNAWQSQAGIVNTGSFFLGNQASAINCPAFPCAFSSNQIGTLAGLVVQSNYNPNIVECGPPLAPTPCGLTAPAGIFPGYPGGATGVYSNTNLTLVHGAPINNFGPRIGIAWQPFSEKFVIRAGYGIFYDAVYANLLANNNGGNPPYNGYVNGAFPGNATDLPVSLAATGGILGWTPRTLQVAAGTPATGATLILDNAFGTGIGPTQIYQFISVPLIQQYNIDLQYAVGHNWVLDVGYVGAHGTHLYNWAHVPNYANLAPNAPNEPAANDIQDRMMIIGSGFQGTPNSFAFNDVANTNPASQVKVNTASTFPFFPTTGNQLGRTPWLGFMTTGLSQTTTQGDSLYDSLQINLKHQWSRGLLVQAAYTWSKLTTNINAPEAGGGIAAPGNVLSGGASSNDPLNFAQQYGPAAFNRSQRFVIAYSYDLPYKNTEGVLGHLLSGWTVAGVTTAQNGEPFTVIDSNGGVIFGAGGFGGGGVRAELNPASTGKCNGYGVCHGINLASSGSNGARVLNGLSGAPCANGWINVQAFGTCTGPLGTFAATGTPCIGGTVQGDCLGSGGGTGFGNSAVGAILGPGQFNWDISLLKNTKITEALTLQFRTEWYNVWNHAQFNPPVNNVGFSTFGQVQNSSVPPRIMQFALKLLF